MDEQSARKLIVEVGKLLYERSYVVASDGNISSHGAVARFRFRPERVVR